MGYFKEVFTAVMLNPGDQNTMYDQFCALLLPLHFIKITDCCCESFAVFKIGSNSSQLYI